MKKIILFAFVLMGCQSLQVKENSRDYMEAATLWVQSAAEVEALCYQAYNAAGLSLDKQLAVRRKRSKKPAVVLDVDETVLDNSPYQATGVLEGRGYSSKSWGKWVEKAQAKAVPGAIEFLKHAHKRGVEIFLVTNRNIKHLDATYKNLVDLGIPVKKENLLLKTTTSSKIERRQKVLKNHEVLIYAGDVLPDFPEGFEHKNVADRSALTKQAKKKFGVHYIVLPNPMYGDWENALYQYKRDYSHAAKRSMRRSFFRPIQ